MYKGRDLVLRLGLLGLLFAGSCSSTEVGSMSGECEPGQRRCLGSEAQRCSDDGVYRTAESCGAENVCVDSLGCVACQPGTSVCANNGTEVHSCNADGSVGSLTSTCSFGQTCRNGSCVDSCEVAASEFVYLVDSDSNFLSFEPRKDGDPTAIKVIGKLNCASGSRPYSMAIDRKARAWVLYTDGNIYLVNPQDASCMPSGYTANQGGFTKFGMGFVSDSNGARTETLYGGNNLSGGALGFFRIDPTTKVLTKFADFPSGVTSSPEFTGTGGAALYGYFPSATAGQHRIVLINRTTGAFDMTWNLPVLPASPNAWAFAHWGGRYYQFVTNGGKNQVRRYDPATQMNTLVQDNTPYRVVGAGVSTCAPLIVG